MKIFIGNLGNEVTSHDLLLLFSTFGEVVAANVSKDGQGRPRGFGYVLMNLHADGEKAIRSLNKKKFKHQFLSVSEAIHSERYCDTVAI
jgi:polyadenylate-binding protein